MVWNLVAHAFFGHDTTSPGTTSPAIDCTGADLIVACCSNNGGTITDSSSNSWSTTPITSSSFNTAQSIRIFEMRNPTVSSSMTFTATWATGAAGLCILAFSGSLTTADPADQFASTNVNFSNVVSTGSITPTQNGEVIAAFLTSSDSNGNGVLVGSGFTVVDTSFNSSLSGDGFMASAYLIQGGLGPVNTTFTLPGANPTTVCAGQVSFKAPPSSAYFAPPTFPGVFNLDARRMF